MCSPAVRSHSLTHASRCSVPAAGSRLAPDPASAFECLKLVVERGGTSVKVRDERGRTLLMLAAEAGNLEAVVWLMNKGKVVRAAGWSLAREAKRQRGTVDRQQVPKKLASP